MSFLDRFLTTITGLAAAPPPVVAETPLREAAGTSVDPDDHEWRPLSTDGKRDLTPVTHERMQKMAVYMWQSNLLANRIVELPLAHLLARGVRLAIDDSDLQDVLKRHWRDPINCWDRKLIKRGRELSVFGEQCWPVFVSPAGFVRIGYLDPAQIETVVHDPDNAEQAIGIVTKKDRKGRARRYRVILNGEDEELFSERTVEIRKTFDNGDCFFFAVNTLCSSTRGRSDLLAQIDWLDAYDQYLFGELDRASFLRAYVWDVTLKGATPEEVEAKAKSITPPKPGGVRVHNDSEEWDALAPTLGAADASEGARLFRNHVLGGATIPEHWYGGASEVNRSTGENMAEATQRMLEMRQAELGYMLVEVGTFVLRQHEGASNKKLDEGMLDTLRVEWPEIASRDTSRYAAALQQIVTAGVILIQEGLLSRLAVVGMVQSVAAELGVPFDAEAELEAAQKELEEIRDLDRFTPPVVDDEPAPEPADA